MEQTYLLPSSRGIVMNTYDSIKELINLSYVKIQSRVLLALLLFTGFFNSLAIRSSFSIVVAVMTENRTVTDQDGHVIINQEFNWNSKETGALLSAFFWGYMATQIIGAILTVRFGGKIILGSGVLIPALLSLASPLCISIGGYWVILTLRVLQGAFAGGIYTAMTSLMSKWTPSLERNIMFTIVSAGGYIGMGGGMLLAGEIVDYCGWQGVFYWFGVSGVVWYLFWLLLATDTPETNKFITSEELNYIQTTRETSSALFIDLKNIPLCKILRSAPVWALSIAMFVQFWAVYTMKTESPRYLMEVYKVNVKTAGILSSISYFSMTFFMISSGYILDSLRKYELFETTKLRKVWILIGYGGQAIFVLALVLTHDLHLSVVFICLALSVGSIAHSGFGSNSIELNPKYSAVTMGITNTIGSLSGFITPLVCGYLTTSGTITEWNNVFVLLIVIDAFGILVYVFLGTSKFQSWESLT